MTPTWFSIIALAAANVFVFYVILKIFCEYDAEMKRRNSEWE